jgi:hypothetical protein
VTEKRRREAAEKFRALLDDKEFNKKAAAAGMKPRALALIAIRSEFNIGRSTLYGYCAKFGVSTK